MGVFWRKGGSGFGEGGSSGQEMSAFDEPLADWRSTKKERERRRERRREEEGEKEQAKVTCCLNLTPGGPFSDNLVQ